MRSPGPKPGLLLKLHYGISPYPAERHGRAQEEYASEGAGQGPRGRPSPREACAGIKECLALDRQLGLLSPSLQSSS
jgi:hypothetical protein